MTIGQRIKKLRINKKLTQTELGLLIGVKKQTISKYEKDINEPQQNTIKLLSEKLECSTDYLIKGVEMIVNDFKKLNELTERKEFDKFIKEVDGITILFKDGTKVKIKTYQYQVDVI